MKKLNLAVATAALAATALPCAPAPHPGDDVATQSESAAILWDSKNKTEHFIRTASFKTAAKDFGFLVPTPTVPELVDVPVYVVNNLFAATSPPVAEDKEGSGGAGAPMPAKSVEVVKQQAVGQYLVTVLKASDANALTEWLRVHDYAVRPALTKWLANYTAKGWMISAFQFKGGNGNGIDTTAVRMSFKTDQPFYPYSEPEDQTNKAIHERRLQVVFLSDQKAMGHLGSQAWPGSVEAASDPDASSIDIALKDLKLPADSAAAYSRASRFTDAMLVRQGTNDVTFETYTHVDRDNDVRDTAKPTESIAYLVGTFSVIVAVIGIGIVMVRRRRR